MHDAVALEQRGVPTAVVVTSDFVVEARTQIDALGMANLQPAVIDHPLSTLSEEDIESRADQAYEQVKAIWRGSAVAPIGDRPTRRRDRP